jgi:hypothetical protein
VNIRTLFLTLFLFASLAFAQPSAQTTFDNAYWASQPPQVQALRNNHNFDLAAQLASQGFAIDNAVMVWGWDPYIIMQQRAAEGLTWIPVNYENPIGCVPGPGYNGPCYALPGLKAIGGQVAYPTVPPANLLTVKVSTNPADFPVYVAPAAK